jgi:sarcosine oxidase subunit gamma
LTPKEHGSVAEQALCRLREITGWSLVEVAGWCDSLDELQSLLTQACGAAPPAGVGEVAWQGVLTLIRTGPGRVWVVDERGDIEGRLAGALDPARGCLTPLGHGWRRWRLEGPKVRELLAKLIALDVEAMARAPGWVVQTSLHHAPVLLNYLGDDAFDLYLPQTFARSLMGWLRDAGLELGLPA